MCDSFFHAIGRISVEEGEVIPPAGNIMRERCPYVGVINR